MQDAYREDLAFIHDAGHGGPARAAASLLLEDLRRRNVSRGLVADLGCGSGILSEPLSVAGFDILGIDISRSHIALAHQRVPNGQFRVDSLLTTELPSCVAVAIVGECLNYLFDTRHNLEGVRQVLACAYSALVPGGLLVFDVAEPGRVPEPGTLRMHREEDGWAVLVTTVEDRQAMLLTRHITSFRKVGELYRRDHEVHRLRLLPHAQVAAWLQEIGFQVQVLDGYGPIRFPPDPSGFWRESPR